MPLKITSDFISDALRTAAVSVEKKGLPVPDAKITTLFSKYSINIEKILQDTKNKKIKNVPVIITTKNTSYKIINKVITDTVIIF